jgi:hypothetical protein
LQHLRAERVSADEQGVRAICDFVAIRVSRRALKKRPSLRRSTVRRDSVVDQIIGRVSIGQWKRATAAALEVLKQTDQAGSNQLFETLLEYQNLPDDHGMLWSALHTIEMCADLAPDLMSRFRLSQMATHPNFSVRATAASICMNWAQFAPDRVPVDIVLRLSAYDEDWYVQAPANATLKSMARAVPGVLQIFYSRLRSSDAEERAHAAACILDIAREEPDLLERDDLRGEAAQLGKLKDRDALDYVRQSIAKLRSKKAASRYRYGL